MSGVDLPEGWVFVKLGDYIEVIRGASPRPKGDPRYFGGEIPWISIRDVNAEKGRFLSKTVEGVTQAGAEKSRLVPIGGLILSNSGSVCIPKILKVEGCIHDGFVTFPDLDKNFCTEYFYNLFDWMRPAVIHANKQGVTQVNLNTGIVKAFNIPIPPLAEQKVIAAKLDELLAQVDSIKTRLDAIPNILKRFRQSVLAAAVSGKLTGITSTATSPIGSLAEVIGGLTKNSKRKEFNIKKPYLRVANVYENELRLDNVQEIGVEEKELDRIQLKKGDLLIVEGNGSIDQIGRVAIWNDEIKGCVHQNHLIKIRLDPKIFLGKYMLYFLMSPQGKSEIVSRATSGAGLFTLSISKISSIAIPIYSLEEQTEIVRRVEQLFAFADQIEQQVKNAQSRVNNLTQSILAKAFRGELTADWRAKNPELISGENSAEALLARIKAERAVMQPVKQQRARQVRVKPRKAG
ncbi:MAG: restriction endonuclease subunit S [Candidatus Competibacteraceae bacterium]|nr:restriction endonuclease subunit S [Candidatus Competibacteraceae bacterium]